MSLTEPYKFITPRAGVARAVLKTALSIIKSRYEQTPGNEFHPRDESGIE